MYKPYVNKKNLRNCQIKNLKIFETISFEAIENQGKIKFGMVGFPNVGKS